jgi:competence protein ComEC
MFIANLVLIGVIIFLLGIFIASLNLNILILFFISFLIFIINYYFKLNLSKKYILFFIFILFFGFFYFHFRIFIEEKNKNLIYNQEIEFSGKIVGAVLNYENYQKFKFRLNKPLVGEIEILTFNFPTYHYGDVLKIKGQIQKNKNFNENPISVFPKITYLKSSPDSKFLFNLFKIKEYFLKQYKNYLGFKESALMSGIILGDRSGFSKEFKENMNNSGVTHIVALSGYNISILVIVLSLSFGFIFGRKLNFFLVLITILGFVLMTGAEASVVRAAIMASFFLLAERIGRIYSFWHSVLLTAALMVLFNPKILVYDLGFQLSFLSLLGMTYFKPVFDKIFKFYKDNQGFLSWKDNLSTTLGAQFAVLPLIFFNFKTFSIFSPLANILILTFIPITMFFGFLLGIFGFFKPLGFVFGLISSFILKYEIIIINFFGQFKTLNFSFINLIIMILIYSVFIFYVFKNKNFINYESK